MSTKQLIKKEVAALPEELQREVYDFARFLSAKRQPLQDVVLSISYRKQ